MTTTSRNSIMQPDDEETYMLDDDDSELLGEPPQRGQSGIRNGFAARLRRTLGRKAADTASQTAHNLDRLYTLKKRRPCLDNRIVRTVVALPILLLSIFGILHIIRSYISGDPFFFPPSASSFLPHWTHRDDKGTSIVHYPTDATRGIIPIPCHSHNDYWRQIPLLSALHAGCISVEADVWLKHDELYVGHNVASLTRNRTLTSLYIDPLLSLLAAQNPSTEFTNTTGHGVFDVDHSQGLVLLIDLKTDGAETWPVVLEQLQPLRQRQYLTTWTPESGLVSRAITVVATGNTPFDLVIANGTYRDVFYDAPLAQLDDRFDTSNSYFASIDLPSTIGRVRRGVFTAAQLATIRAQVQAANERGLKARYWDTPAWPVSLRNKVWATLVNEGVGLLNVDDLEAASMGDWGQDSHGLIS